MVSWDTQHVMVTCVMTDMWLVLTKFTYVLLQQIILNLLKSSFEIYTYKMIRSCLKLLGSSCETDMRNLYNKTN
jgi:hypothetical protein